MTCLRLVDVAGKETCRSVMEGVLDAEDFEGAGVPTVTVDEPEIEVLTVCVVYTIVLVLTVSNRVIVVGADSTGDRVTVDVSSQGSVTVTMIPRTTVVFVVLEGYTAVVVLHFVQDSVTVAQLVGPGETTTVAVVSHGSVTVTVVPPTTVVLTVLVVRTAVLVLHFVHGTVSVTVEYPDGTGEITSVSSEVSHGSVIVTTKVPLVDVNVV